MENVKTSTPVNQFDANSIASVLLENGRECLTNLAKKYVETRDDNDGKRLWQAIIVPAQICSLFQYGREMTMPELKAVQHIVLTDINGHVPELIGALAERAGL